MRRRQRRLESVFTLRLQIFGKLDDQNRVFRRQADHGDQTDLEINIIRQASPPSAQNHTEQTQRHDQNHRQRNRPTFVQRSQTQKYSQNRERIQNRGLRAGSLLLFRLTGPLKTKALRQFGRQLRHLRHRLATAVTGTRAAGNRHRRIAVVAHGLHRSCDPRGRHHTR